MSTPTAAENFRISRMSCAAAARSCTTIRRIGRRVFLMARRHFIPKIISCLICSCQSFRRSRRTGFSLSGLDSRWRKFKPDRLKPVLRLQERTQITNIFELLQAQEVFDDAGGVCGAEDGRDELTRFVYDLPAGHRIGGST